MLSPADRLNVVELLSGLSNEDVFSLCNTITKGLIKPNTPEEATEAILHSSYTVASILNRQKVTKELLFNYIFWKNIPLRTDNRDKNSLVNVLLGYWNETPTKKIVTESNSNCGSKVGVEPGQVDLFAHEFAEWFYQLLNKDFFGGVEFALTPDTFWANTSLHLKVDLPTEVMVEIAEGSEAVLKLLNDIKQRFKLYFSPNLSSEGVRGRSEPHGLIAVLVCGTLHQAAGVMVGVFEQTFTLMRDPLSGTNSWKVKGSQLHLVSKTDVTALPTLGQGSLTGPLLPITNPD